MIIPITQTDCMDNLATAVSNLHKQRLPQAQLQLFPDQSWVQLR